MEGLLKTKFVNVLLSVILEALWEVALAPAHPPKALSSP
jgi:hypothetical protein